MRRQGFTLVELLVVIAILGITAVAVAPALARATADDPTARAARAVEQLLSDAQTRALERATSLNLVMTEQGRWWIRGFNPQDAILDSGTIMLDEGTRLQSPAARPTFRFSATGAVDADSLVVIGPTGARALVVDRWTGGVRVHAR